MEVDLVNVFVEKQRDVINDLMARGIMLEARLTIAEKHAAKVIELGEKLSNTEGQLKMLHEQNAAMNASIENYKKEINSLIAGKTEKDNIISSLRDQVGKVDELQSLVNKLTLEKESQRAKADRLKKKVQEIASE
jgi:predicted RNase H-like nuclease (RuvC/YqgF family)